MFFFFNDTATTEIYTLSLHDALPISSSCSRQWLHNANHQTTCRGHQSTRASKQLPRSQPTIPCNSSPPVHTRDRKSTRLNSSHTVISYAVFCLKKKKNNYRLVVSSSK